jgi:type I restriction enzyme, R subunit
MTNKTANDLKLDERHHVEEPLLTQLKGLHWQVIDLTNQPQQPKDTFRENLLEVVILPVLHKQLQVEPRHKRQTPLLQFLVSAWR